MIQMMGRTDLNRHSFARRAVKGIPKVISDPSTDQGIIPGKEK